MKNLTIKQKLYSLNIAILITVVIMVTFTVSKVIDIEDEYNHMESQASVAKSYTLQINSDLNFLSRVTRDIMLGNDYDGNIIKVNNTVDSINSLFKSLDKVTVDSKGKAILSHSYDETMKFVKYSQLLMQELQTKTRDIQTLQNTYVEYKKYASPLAKDARVSFAKLVDLKTIELKNISDQVHNSISTIKTWLPSLIILNIIVIIMIYFVVRTIISNIQKVEDGLLGFFGFLNRENKKVSTLDITTNDEIGVMAKAINENIIKVEKNLADDLAMIENTRKIAAAVKRGYLKSRIKKSSNSPELNKLKDVVNDMLETVSSNIGSILYIVKEYSQYKYTNRIDVSNMDAQVKQLASGVNGLGDVTSNMLVDDKRNGLILDEYSDILMENVELLSTSANQQAASLEETAASVEEITSIIKQSSEKAQTMANLASDTKRSASTGKELATKTADAMGQINSSTTAIADAITVIDQIAFQTNILSLNAAVEAATAGEAGKGFAVVAGEVRNLAARSADAANEIKSLVEEAKQKADEGKSVSAQMISGYEELDSNINQTTELIEDVAAAAKEQLSGMSQINDAVMQLDQATQENAKMATETNMVAIDTDRISKEVVTKVNEKEFDGKDSIDITNDIIQTSLKTQQKLGKEKENDDSWDSF